MSKWLNKRTQAVSELVNKGTRKTEYESDFVELMKQTDATKKVIEKLTAIIPTYLHPNPTARAKVSVGTTYAKLMKTAAEKRYQHAIGEVAETMTKGSAELDGDSAFGRALRETGDALNQLTEAQHGLDAEVYQNFLDPLKAVIERDVKELMKHRKKLEGRRLDYDYKVRKREGGKSSITDADIKIAEQKMEESKQMTENGMLNLIDNDVEQVSQLTAFVDAMLNYHKTSTDILEALRSNLQDILSDASSRPHRERRQMVSSFESDEEDAGGDEPARAKAIFDFEAENDGELSFKEGDMINLLNRLDENWLEGEIRGRTGIFPSNYVQIVKDL